MMKSHPSPLLLHSAQILLTLSVVCFGAGGSSAQGHAPIRLKTGDTIRVDVFNEPLVTGVFLINSEGRIDYPLLGKLSIVGKTTDQVATDVEKRLEKDYIRDARVSASVTARPQQSVLVIGQVNNPGRIRYAASESMDLFTAIASTGGMTTSADKTRIEVRTRDGASKTVSLDTHRKLRLQDGSSVVVGAAPVTEKRVERITVLGEVKSPGMIELPQGQKTDLLTAIGLAGGFGPKARPSKIIVTRRDTPIKLNGAKMRKGLEKRFVIQPGDSIFVSESIF